ncbi:MAG: molybdenum ABC transporter ATP-binding protein [Candidatus Competibacteraceae bacterium]
MLELTAIRLTQGKFTLQGGFELALPVAGVFGPSGAGKSTLLKAIAGLAQPHAGRIRLDGETLYDAEQRIHVPPQRRRIGIVFQDSRLFPHLTVRHNLLYGFKLLSPAQRRFSLPQIVDLLEIGPLLKRRPRYLSGGEQQRVALGRALLASPRLLLLDEPLASLDGGLKRQILPFLRRVRDELRLPMLYVSHALNEILALTSHLVVIDSGRIVGQGALPDLIQQDAMLPLARSLGLENVLEIEVLRHDPALGCTTVRYDHHELYLPLSDLPVGTRTFAALRATDIALARRPITQITIQNQLPGRVVRLREIADRVLVDIDIGAPIQAEIIRKAVHDLQLAVGDTVYCLCKVRAWHYLGEV